MGVLPCGDQVPPLEQDVNDAQTPVSPPFLINGNIRDAIFQMAQSITTHEQLTTTEV